jgi:hypothetical protein
MPQILLAAAAKTAVAAPVVTAAAPTLSAAGTTAALELAKQQAIQAGMKQMGTEAAKQVGVEATKQVGTEVAKQGLAQAGQQTGVEAMKQGIFSNPAGVPPTAGTPITPAGPATPLPPAGGPPVATPTAPPMTLEQQLAQIKANPTDLSKFPRYEQVATGPGGQTPLVEKATMGDPSQSFSPFKPSGPSGPVPEFITPDVALPGKAPVTQPPFAAKPYTDPGTFARAGSQAAEKGIAQMNTTPTSELMLKPTYAEQFPLAPESPLAKGAREAFEWMGDNKINTGLGLMSLGQYMNQPEEEDKDKYKSTVDMSEFKPSTPVQRPFTRSYEYQSYAVGGPVEQMAAMNAVGANTGYPMANLQTSMYSNPAVQRPEAVNVVAPSAGAGVGAYSGEQRFAEGGLSAAERREYGLRTRGQRAAQSLTKSYEEMEEERQKEAMRLFNERSDPGIIRRSRTQEMSSPFSAAMAEHARLGKKTKVPVVEMPKTNLGDIDNYMDIPIEAAKGGIMHGLGGYSDGGRLLRGPGDGVSDSIPAVIGKRQPARLADGEFVIPARIVSELGNGSTEAGARKLYAMMERVQATRKKSIGKKKVAVNSKADKHLPA